MTDAMPGAMPGAGARSGRGALAASAFVLELDGLGPLRVQRVEGVSSRTEVVDQRSATATGRSVLARAAGRLEPGELTVARPFHGEPELWTWYEEVVERGEAATMRDGSLLVLDPSGRPLIRWDVATAWPRSWKLSGLEPGASGLPVEEVVLVHRGLRRASP